jgi:dGTPase
VTLRETIEDQELLILSPRAAKARFSRGRTREEAPCPLRTCFMRDRDRVIHSKAFRRLKQKTQMFVAPERDHYRTRLTHTLEVSQIARTVARNLRLNEDLTETIALAHDLGHTPFGHAGERALREVSGLPFEHNVQSVRVVEVLEKDGQGLNLSAEVLNGIRCHTGKDKAFTLEGQVVAMADRIAYINHDIDDAIRAGLLSEDDLPAAAAAVLGRGHRARINTLVTAMVEYGLETGEIGMDAARGDAMNALRNFMFATLYVHPVAKGEEGKGMAVIQLLYRHFFDPPRQMPPEYVALADRDGLAVAVCDYIAGMTDRYAVATFNDLYIPKGWNG